MIDDMPKLWTETVASHRLEVREAVLDAVGELVMSRGLLAVTMSQLAESTGIGRATLYKYFGDVEEVLTAWHQRHVAGHLAELTEIAGRSDDPAARLRLVLKAYADICRLRHRHGGDALAAALHRNDQADSSERQLQELLAALITEAAGGGGSPLRCLRGRARRLLPTRTGRRRRREILGGCGAADSGRLGRTDLLRAGRADLGRVGLGCASGRTQCPARRTMSDQSWASSVFIFSISACWLVTMA